MKNKLDDLNENDFPLNFDDEYNKEEIKFEIKQVKNSVQLYYIEFDQETGMYQVVFNRDEKEYIPQVEDCFNFRFFYYLQKNSNFGEDDSLLIIDVKMFLSFLHSKTIKENEEYLLMRWNPATEWWNTSKFSKFKAIEFLKGYVFVNWLLTKSSRGMHYEAEHMDYFRWKFCKAHVSHGHARWLCLHKDCAELEEPFELWNLDFIGAQERIKVPHKITHSMVLLTKLENQECWSVSSKIQSQEDFIK